MRVLITGGAGLIGSHLADLLLSKSSVTPYVTGKYHAGDIGRCFADLMLPSCYSSRRREIGLPDTTALSAAIGWRPRMGLQEGLRTLERWLRGRFGAATLPYREVA
jgi:nucleoside-diphosphate-sugar epimerase